MKTYYLPSAVFWDTAFFDREPVCLDRKEAERIYDEWYGEFGEDCDVPCEFDDLFWEVTEDEIEEYDVFDSDDDEDDEDDDEDFSESDEQYEIEFPEE